MTADLDLYQIQRQRGGVVYDGGRRWIGPGPNHSRKDASLSVVIASDGRSLVYSFAGDPFPACADWLGLRRDDARPMDDATRSAMIRQREAEARRRAQETQALVHSVWSGARPIEGTAAETYLLGRGLLLEGGDDVRFHPAAPRSRDGSKPSHPGMVGLVRNAKAEPIGLHLTYLDAGGRKAFGNHSRLMFGTVAGGAVRLAPIGLDGVLAVAEGIETAAAFWALKGIPTWAALSTSGLQSLVLPAGVRRLLIAADSDDAGAGLRSARDLAERARRVCDVELHAAPEGMDWADVAEASR